MIQKFVFLPGPSSVWKPLLFYFLLILFKNVSELLGSSNSCKEWMNIRNCDLSFWQLQFEHRKANCL